MTNKRKLDLISDIVNDVPPPSDEVRPVVLTSGGEWCLSLHERATKFPRLIPLMKKSLEGGWEKDDMQKLIREIRSLQKHLEREYSKYCNGEKCP